MKLKQSVDIALKRGKVGKQEAESPKLIVTFEAEFKNGTLVLMKCIKVRTK